MKPIKVAAAALNQTPLDWDRNAANIVGAIEAARADGVSVLCLPELCISGYGCEDAFHSAATIATAAQVLGEILPETHGLIVALGLPVLSGGGRFNAAALAVDGELIGLAAKQNLAGQGIHYEPRWFKPWPVGHTSEIEMAGRRVPLGDLVFECGGIGIGFEICEDAWVADRPGSELARRGADVILNPSASHFAFDKQEIRRRFVLEGSRAFAVSYVYANLLGNEAGRAIYDGGTLIASGGQMLCEGPRFSYRQFHVQSTVVDIDATRAMRAGAAGSMAPPSGEPATTVRVEFDFPPSPTESSPSDSSLVDRPAWEESDAIKEEEFSRAVSLGLFDYLRKSRSRGFVVSISGGADSAAVSTLVALLADLGVRELGAAAFAGRLEHIPGIDEAKDAKDFVRRLLTCVYQSTRNSSQTTLDAARGVAEALSAEFLQFDVDQLVQDYVEMVSTAVGRELTWERDDVALQNIQARARAPGVWMLANLRGALLLATSNRSEAAVGYATMDGDTCGGLSPIAGIDKAFLRHWLRWMESSGPADSMGPISMLCAVNAQQPTAELRPQESGQTDEEDLMPYDVLDWIERAAIRDKHAPVDVFQLAVAHFSNYDRQQLGRWIERFFILWARNQWKRERYAPSFHLDDENLDPKTWCRFPILSGGFERELRELRAMLS
jgi:NAD+ synthase (glutamine-hydrolysing)